MTMTIDRDLLPGELLIESSIDAMIAIGADDRIMAWNRAAAILFSRQRAEVTGSLLSDVLPSLKDDPDIHTAIQWARQGHKSFLAASAAFPHRSHAEIHIIPLQSDEAIIGVMLLIHDVSHRIAKERELQTLNEELENRLHQLHIASRELSQLTQVTSHSIRKPIRDTYSLIEGLLRSEAGNMSSQGKATFRRIQSSLTRMSLLVDDIITLSQIHIDGPPGSTVDMEELVQELQTQFGKKLRDSNTVLTTGELCTIIAHRNQMLLLLQQVLANVIRFTAPGPPRIHLHCSKTRRTPATGTAPRDYFLLSIMHNSTAFDQADPGMTLPVADDADIRSYTGPAIALLIAARIMEVHAGFLEIEKTGQEETTIRCFFPSGRENTQPDPAGYGLLRSMNNS